MPLSEIHTIIALLSLPGVGRRTAQKILGRLTDGLVSSPEELMDTLTDSRKTGVRLRMPSLHEAEGVWRKAEEIIKTADRLGIKILVPSSGEFPTLQAGLTDPPLLLHVLGDVGCLRGRLMYALIGTRVPSDFGRHWARDAGRWLAREGAVVVSGLARGCDTEGHRGCLDEAGRTVAVLAHGLDLVHPRQNSALAQRILDGGGALVSEYPAGAWPTGWRFIERDRLQAGLSHGLILVETGVHGGSMHAVRHILALGRPLGCLRHTGKMGNHRQSEGNRMLIKEVKAVPLSSEADLGAFVQSLSNVRP